MKGISMGDSNTRINGGDARRTIEQRAQQLGVIRFFMRYPVFLLVFGPPLFRASFNAGDTSQAHGDIWSFFQVLLLGTVAIRAVLRLLSKHSILLLKGARSVFVLMLFLGMLYAFSILYSPGKAVSAAFTAFYFANVICLIEFVVDAYHNPPDWLQCVFQLRLVGILLYFMALAWLPIRPAMVMNQTKSAGIRFMGGAVCAAGIMMPMVVVISAYCFLYKLESRTKSTFLFLFGMAGVLVTQVRGAELTLLFILGVLILWRAKSSLHGAYFLAGGLLISILAGGVLLALVSPEKVWSRFNRNQDTQGILTASGRTLYWQDVIVYATGQPWGAGYISGVRNLHFGVQKDNLHALLKTAVGADNSYIQTLVDAGWLAFAAYLMIVGRVFAMGWRFSTNQDAMGGYRDPRREHAMRCLLLVFSLCLIEAMESSEFAIPLRQCFYLQNALIATIIGLFTSMSLTARAVADEKMMAKPLGQRLRPSN